MSVLSSDQIRVCACGVVVVDFEFSGELRTYDPGFLQRRWIRSLWPREMVAPHGFGWRIGEPHICCDRDQRPVDVLARMNAEKGMGLAGDGTYEGPSGKGGGAC